MTTRQHTHKGHCQICGRLQAIDIKTGRIAAHGYQVPAHWHQRTSSCAGAKALPYQKGRDMIPAVIDMLKREAARATAAAATLRAEGTDRDLGSDYGVTIARTAAGLVYRRWNRVNSWDRAAGAKPTLKSEHTPREHMPYFEPNQADEFAATEWAKAVEFEAVSFDREAANLVADAERYQARFDAWVPDAPLVPVAPK